jgi:uncharacterized protein GlcG (DUF336 family)
MPTHEWFQAISDEPALREGIVHRDRLVIFGGGVPIIRNGEAVGAVGGSGGSAAQDRESAEAGTHVVRNAFALAGAPEGS